jgi:hypothetical protein
LFGNESLIPKEYTKKETRSSGASPDAYVPTALTGSPKATTHQKGETAKHVEKEEAMDEPENGEAKGYGNQQSAAKKKPAAATRHHALAPRDPDKTVSRQDPLAWNRSACGRKGFKSARSAFLDQMAVTRAVD